MKILLIAMKIIEIKKKIKIVLIIIINIYINIYNFFYIISQKY